MNTMMKDFTTSLYLHKYNAEIKNPDKEETIFVIVDNDEVENKNPGESKLIRPKIKRKPPVTTTTRLMIRNLMQVRISV